MTRKRHKVPRKAFKVVERETDRAGKTVLAVKGSKFKRVRTNTRNLSAFERSTFAAVEEGVKKNGVERLHRETQVVTTRPIGDSKRDITNVYIEKTTFSKGKNVKSRHTDTVKYDVNKATGKVQASKHALVYTKDAPSGMFKFALTVTQALNSLIKNKKK